MRSIGTTAAPDSVALTRDEFMRSYRVGETLTAKLVNSGEIVARRVGNKTLIERASAQAWFERAPVIRNSRS